MNKDCLINNLKALTNAMDEIDLRNEIIRLKKRMSVYREENQMLKVKVRKLSTQMLKKDKEIEALLNPNQISNFRKVFSERSVAIISQLREENEKLEKQLNDKNTVIKKLQDNLKIAKCYTSDVMNKKIRFNKNSDLRKEKLQLILNLKEKETSSNCFTPDDQQTLIEMSEPTSANDESKDDISRTKNYSPESDLDRTELFYPRKNRHEEINYLEDHFLDLLTEVDYLKNTISMIQSEQFRTKHVLEKKDDNIEKLSEEIQHLKLIKNHNTRSISSAKSHNCSKKEKHEILKKLYGSSKSKKEHMPKIIIIKEIPSNTENKSTETIPKEISQKESSSKKSDKEDDSEAETY